MSDIKIKKGRKLSKRWWACTLNFWGQLAIKMKVSILQVVNYSASGILMTAVSDHLFSQG